MGTVEEIRKCYDRFETDLAYTGLQCLDDIGAILDKDARTEANMAINLDLASENEDLTERIGKFLGYIDFLRNTAQGKTKSLNLLEKVVKGELEEIRACRLS